MIVNSLFEVLNKGGSVAWILAALSAVLWYALGYRYLFLKSKYETVAPGNLLNRKEIDASDLLGNTLAKLRGIFTSPMEDKESALQFELKNFHQLTCQHRQTVRAIVVVAPLLGLLGTVIGMIETFESLQDSALFSQSGGIAGGISQALITTQMGLVVAIPGLLIGKKLDRKEEFLNDYVGEAVSFESLRKGRA